jgi:hypothetical protein
MHDCELEKHDNAYLQKKISVLTETENGILKETDKLREKMCFKSIIKD